MNHGCSTESAGCWDSEAAGSSLISDVLSKLGGVSDVSITSGLTSNSNNSGVDGAGNTVTLLHIDLWKLEVGLVIGVVVLKISLGGAVNDVSHLESFDGFVLGGNSTAVKASNSIRMSLVLLRSPVISSL